MASPNFPSTGLVPNKTTFKVGELTYLWDGEKWSTITAAITASQISTEDSSTIQVYLDRNRVALEATYKAQGYNNIFFFEDGFTYTNSNDIGIYEDGTAWTYTDASALPVTITAGTVPSEGVYTLVTGVKASNVLITSGANVQEYIDKNSLTTIQLINSSLDIAEGESITTKGFYTDGDGGGTQWVKTADTDTPSQTPVDMGDAKFTDDSGSVWNLVNGQTVYYNGEDLIYPLGFGEYGEGIYSYTEGVFDYIPSGNANTILGSFSELYSMSPSEDGESRYVRFICPERANAEYLLQPSGYVALAGDVTFSNGRVAALQIDGNVNVKWFGAVGDGSADDTAAIQDALDYASRVTLKPLGGMQVIFPAGVYRTSSKLQVESDVVIVGDGISNTYIKPLDSAIFAPNEAVVQTKDFQTTQGTDIWNYYSPYPNGLIMGLGIRDITIDGNRDNVANAGGLFIYGGKWSILNIGVINTDDHGIWTEAGRPVSSTEGDDLHDFLNMHESYASNVYICNSNKHGWFYRGPNDSAITDVQVKTCRWGGFFQESTGNNSVGNLEVGSLHVYSCNCGHDVNGAMITFANVNAQFVYVDASLKNGLLLENSASIIDQVIVLNNNQGNSGSFWGVIVNVASQINMIRNAEANRTSGVDGGLLQVNAASSVISQIRTIQASGTTISQKGIELNSSCTISSAVVGGYDTVGSVGVDISAQNVNLGLQANNCLVAVDYNRAGRNTLNLNCRNCTNDILFNVTVSASDSIDYATTKRTNSEHYIGKLVGTSYNHRITEKAPTEFVEVNLFNESFIKLTGIPQNTTVVPPINKRNGDVLDFYFQQDGTGGHTITWDAIFKTNYSDAGNTPYKRYTIKFVFDGQFWVQQGNGSGWL